MRGDAIFALNFALCTYIGVACLCRIAKGSAATTLARWRLVYSILLMLATASGFAPILFLTPPALWWVVIAASVALLLRLGASHWAAGVPPRRSVAYGSTRLMPLRSRLWNDPC